MAASVTAYNADRPNRNIRKLLRTHNAQTKRVGRGQEREHFHFFNLIFRFSLHLGESVQFFTLGENKRLSASAIESLTYEPLLPLLW
jgi:hypothetical protein